MSHPPDGLADARRLLLTTFGPDGATTTAATWVVPDGSGLGVWAPADSPAVRQVRSRPRMLVAACDPYGRPVGRVLAARAAVCGPEHTARYRTSLIDKYGLAAVFALARSRLRVGLAGTVGIRITLAAPALLHPWHPDPWYSPN
ncbi:PPOX class probable F420-dependent enzyme [Streptomyces sp. TLI_235]|nr:PPOX class F420-dependent enzyme [Streptomyces sp. TLI_235]PBC71868.1 PPOX class probable F420-dependent enzyme [Streptomyces sp. TLI_235]